ncbi:MAG: N4-gp56 family major capsid protein [Pseudomonas sp.]
MSMQYNAPPGTPSSIGPQHTTHFQIKKALVTARTEQYFTQLAEVRNMPKNMGKTMKVFEYIPLLDDRNVNDQGIDAAGAVITPGSGNLYGSSKDIGTITGKLPLLGEDGGRKNRVGFTRVEWEGSIQKLGFFTEFTEDQLQFDSDDQLMSHLTTELVSGAVQLSEGLVQRDLLAAAGTVVYAGAATTNATVTAEGAGASLVNFLDFQRLSITLDENRTPKTTKVISGTRMVDTRTVGAGRIMYIGSEMQAAVENMLNQFGTPAFIPAHKYAAAGTLITGEIGTVGHFRIVVVPEMFHWSNGATVVTNPGYRETDGKYNVYPLLVVGSEAFSTIGFQTDGKVVKFRIITKMPGEATADKTDPYGETGFKSIRFWYGSIVYRPERVAVYKAVAPL